MLPEFVKERRWRPDALCPERFARQRRIAERAACAQGPLLHCDAPLLAEAGGARWHVEAAADDASRVVSTSTCGQGSPGEIARTRGKKLSVFPIRATDTTRF